MSFRRLPVAGLAPVLLLLLLLLPSCSPTSVEPARVPTPGPSIPAASSTAASRAEQAATADPPRTPSTTGEKESTSALEKPDALVAQAEKTAKVGDLNGAIRLVERALAAEPSHRNALFLLAFFSQERAYELERPMSSPIYLKSARAIRTLRDTYQQLSVPERELLALALYNEARTYAVQGQADKAVDALSDALDAGFFDLETIAGDDELGPIRKLPRYAELIKKAEQNARARAGEHARKLVAETTPFPFHFDLPDLSGKKVTSDDLKANLLIVDVWGTWCPPCRKEIPHFKELLAKYRDRGLAIVGVNYERVAEEDVKATIKAFVKENQVPYTCLIGDDKTRDQIPDFVGYPTTLFLDRSGKVRAKSVGYQSLVDLEALVTILLESSEKNQEK